MGHEARQFQTMSVFEADAVPIQDGNVQWVPVRRRLGITAFGTNVYRAAEKGVAVIEEHVESPGQEELYVVLSGSARFVVGDEEIVAPTGSAVFVPDPDARRRGDALEDGTVVMAIGGWPDQAYRSLPWEPIYMAQESMRQGDWSAAADTLEREGGEHLDTAILQFRLACCHARLGEHDRALRELRRAIEIKPELRKRASDEEHLASLRTLEGWAGVVG